MALPTEEEMQAALQKSLHAQSVTVSGKSINRMSVTDAIKADRALADRRLEAAGLRPFIAGTDMSGALTK